MIVIIEALRWLEIVTDTGIRLKVETTAQEIYQQLLYFITIDVRLDNNIFQIRT